eukprot:CAMPEP_0114563692 /NCGR_PEP_ID=MMETSP0114-20121206/13267_1 /TAXON_ID=31324 /ORGANISM="Goniomonas sp, Strain m" /LENGTH=37 /DNA_ID= /DNA_START= /DNA_END= /DNA_ORIENTATION=
MSQSTLQGPGSSGDLWNPPDSNIANAGNGDYARPFRI